MKVDYKIYKWKIKLRSWRVHFASELFEIYIFVVFFI